MKRKIFDVVVIGGGYSGCSTAYYLTKEGMKVALIEKDAICSGASGRNGGQVIQLEGREELTRDKVIKRNRITEQNKKLLDGLTEELGVDVEFIKNGSVDVAFTEEEVEVIWDVIEIQKETGDTEIEFLNTKQLHEVCPAYGSNAIGAKLRRDDGSINPFKMAHGFANAAQKNGCEIYSYTEVLELIFEGDTVTGVITPDDEFYANEAVVCATNAWTKYLLDEYPVMPCKILGFVTEELPIVPVISVEAYPLDIGVYGSSQKHGSILIGGAPFDYPKNMDDHLNQNVFYDDFMLYGKLFRYMWPNVRDVSFIRAWAGAVAFTPDSFPLVGPTKYPNLFLTVGFTNGNCWCPICGQLLAEYIANEGRTSIPIDFMYPERFDGQNFEWPKEYNYTVLHNYIAGAT